MTVTVYVADIAEFGPLLKAAGTAVGCQIQEPLRGYWRIEAEHVLEFSRKELGLGPALWNSALSGGFRGRITEYGRDTMRIECEGQS